MTLPDWLTRDADGHIHLAGHRIGLEDVVHCYVQGDSPEMLHCRFPTVALPLFYKTIAFYLEHPEEVNAYCGAATAVVSQHRGASQPGPSVEELRRRCEARGLPSGDPFWQHMLSIWNSLDDGGHHPRTREQIDAELQSLDDDAESEMEAMERLQREWRRR